MARKRRVEIKAPQRAMSAADEEFDYVPFVEVAGMLVPPWVTFEAVGDDSEPDVSVTVRVESGTPYLHELKITARDARSQILDADLRVATSQSAEDLVKGLMGNLPKAVRINDDGSETEIVRDRFTYTALRAATARSVRRARDGQKRRHLEAVAATYRAGGHKGAQAVADEWEISLRTAQLWIKQAREAGLLGPALKGKAGEA